MLHALARLFQLLSTNPVYPDLYAANFFLIEAGLPELPDGVIEVTARSTLRGTLEPALLAEKQVVTPEKILLNCAI